MKKTEWETQVNAAFRPAINLIIKLGHDLIDNQTALTNLERTTRAEARVKHEPSGSTHTQLPPQSPHPAITKRSQRPVATFVPPPKIDAATPKLYKDDTFIFITPAGERVDRMSAMPAGQMSVRFQRMENEENVRRKKSKTTSKIDRLFGVVTYSLEGVTHQMYLVKWTVR